MVCGQVSCDEWPLYGIPWVDVSGLVYVNVYENVVVNYYIILYENACVNVFEKVHANVYVTVYEMPTTHLLQSKYKCADMFIIRRKKES